MSDVVQSERAIDRGRHATERAVDETAAAHQRDTVKELFRVFGKPLSDKRINGSRRLVFNFPKGQDGIAFVRVSSDDKQDGTTLLGQANRVREFVHEQKLHRRVRQLVVTINNPGDRPFEERPDFMYFQEQVALGWVRLVVWERIDRLARSVPAGSMFLEWCQELDIGLYVKDFHGRVDFEGKDEILAHIYLAFAKEQKKAIAQRASTGVIARLEAGYALTNVPELGFRKGDDKKLRQVLADEPDEWREWQARRLIVELACDPGPGGACAAIVPVVFKHFGIKLKAHTVAALLRTKSAEDGRVVQRGAKVEVLSPKVPLVDPIDPDVGDRARRNLQRRPGKTTATPLYGFMLNGVEQVVHLCNCADDRRGFQSVLYGRQHQHEAVYMRKRDGEHCQHCNGPRLFRDDVELLAGAALADAIRTLPDRHALDQTRIDELVDELVRADAQAKRMYARLAPNAPESDDELRAVFQKLAPAAENRVKQIETQLLLATRISKLPAHTSPVSDRRLLVAAADDLLTYRGPDNVRRERAALLMEYCVERVEVRTEPTLRVRLVGPEVWDGEPTAQALYPLQRARAILSDHALDLAREARARQEEAVRPAESEFGQTPPYRNSWGGVRPNCTTSVRTAESTSLSAGQTAWSAVARTEAASRAEAA